MHIHLNANICTYKFIIYIYIHWEFNTTVGTPTKSNLILFRSIGLLVYGNVCAICCYPKPKTYDVWNLIAWVAHHLRFTNMCQLCKVQGMHQTQQMLATISSWLPWNLDEFGMLVGYLTTTVINKAEIHSLRISWGLGSFYTHWE